MKEASSKLNGECYHVRELLSMGSGLEMGFIYHLQVVTTNKYNTIGEFHTLSITPAHATFCQTAFTSCFLVTDFNTVTTTVLLNYTLQISL
jgi:hypothetical protein